jgi:hypothetical protein
VNLTAIPCPYCGGAAPLEKGTLVYPHRRDLADKWFYVCQPCQAWVGCHPGTITPLGRLANAELRAAKQVAHTAFDPLWRPGRSRRHESRRQAYAWLAKELGIPRDEAHIGMFDVDLCRRTVKACKALHVRQADKEGGPVG